MKIKDAEVILLNPYLRKLFLCGMIGLTFGTGIGFIWSLIDLNKG